MTRTVLVVPTDHGVGLTATCLGPASAHCNGRGVNVGFYKPVAQPRAPGAGQRPTPPRSCD